MKTYIVTIPIAGHVSFEVEAENEDSAKAAAWEKDPTSKDAELSWEQLETFGRGNVCYCPSPWEVDVHEV
jgi:hypothetical protein